VGIDSSLKGQRSIVMQDEMVAVYETDPTSTLVVKGADVVSVATTTGSQKLSVLMMANGAGEIAGSVITLQAGDGGRDQSKGTMLKTLMKNYPGMFPAASWKHGVYEVFITRKGTSGAAASTFPVKRPYLLNEDRNILITAQKTAWVDGPAHAFLTHAVHANYMKKVGVATLLLIEDGAPVHGTAEVMEARLKSHITTERGMPNRTDKCQHADKGPSKWFKGLMQKRHSRRQLDLFDKWLATPPSERGPLTFPKTTHAVVIEDVLDSYRFLQLPGNRQSMCDLAVKLG